MDELTVKRATFTARTGNLSREFADFVSGYAVSVDACVQGSEDSFPITGGSGTHMWDK